MQRKKKGSIFRQERSRIFKDTRGDVYREKKKYAEPTRCMDCGALFINGRWTWNDTTAETHKAVCPACKRIEDNYPAGFVEMSGPFFDQHRKEILHMIRNLERTESSEHPLERIMSVEEENGLTTLTTTGMHIARRVGDALSDSYQGELDISYDAENFVRIKWQR